jgi:hypothetical protein
MDVALTPQLGGSIINWMDKLQYIGNGISSSPVTNYNIPVVDRSLNGVLKNRDTGEGPNWGDIIVRLSIFLLSLLSSFAHAHTPPILFLIL